MAEFQICPLNSEDKEWVTQFIAERWGAEFIVAHGKVYYPRELPGFVAITNARRAGLISYVIEQEGLRNNQSRQFSSVGGHWHGLSRSRQRNRESA